MLKLYTYFRSSAAYRVRIALNLKGLSYEAIPVHLIREGGQQNHDAYRTLSPLGTVPTLETGNEAITQSLAIIEYLDETHRQAPLLPDSPADRARVRELALTIACDIHPINNLRVLNYLTCEFGVGTAQKGNWYRHWISEGLQAVEALLAASPATGTFCHGETPGLADCCLVPQVFNARRFACPLENMPTIRRIVAACEVLPAFQEAAPDRQPDAE
ncbi:maleylacetoacetate isomerase [Dechloromonas sp. ARDL1]|uniref:maleylacetoacetate isomerase n=1 Tax=Dechloromonas sp. ARDL1 TaxID=3322121 RepID=UPI003DA75B0A